MIGVLGDHFRGRKTYKRHQFLKAILPIFSSTFKNAFFLFVIKVSNNNLVGGGVSNDSYICEK